MPLLFSATWIEALDAAARSVVGPAEALVIQQVVTDDDGERAWHVDLGPDAVRVQVGRADAPDVTFTQDRATAEAIVRGELSAGAALTAGHLTVRGTTAKLTEHRDVLIRLDAALAAVRADA